MAGSRFRHFETATLLELDFHMQLDCAGRNPVSHSDFGVTHLFSCPAACSASGLTASLGGIVPSEPLQLRADEIRVCVLPSTVCDTQLRHRNFLTGTAAHFEFFHDAIKHSPHHRSGHRAGIADSRRSDRRF